MDRRVLWEIRTSRPLTVAALAFLGAYAVPILWPASPSWALTACAVTEWVVWGVFIADLLIRVGLAHDRRGFLQSAWLDIALLAVPMLRPLRALRAVVALSILGRRGGEYGRGRVVGSVGAAVLLVAFVAALAALEAERAVSDSKILTFGDSIWWAAATVTTVGYGDLTPISTEGRLVAMALMVTGIGLLGVVTAALASWFVERVGKVEESTEQTAVDVDALLLEVRLLREDLERALATRAAPGGPGSGRVPRARE